MRGEQILSRRLTMTHYLCIRRFFFNDTATTEIYTLSLHDALPICGDARREPATRAPCHVRMGELAVLAGPGGGHARREPRRSEEHTSELQSRQYLVCRLLLEKKTKLARAHTHSRATPISRIPSSA